MRQQTSVQKGVRGLRGLQASRLPALVAWGLLALLMPSELPAADIGAKYGGAKGAGSGSSSAVVRGNSSASIGLVDHRPAPIQPIVPWAGSSSSRSRSGDGLPYGTGELPYVAGIWHDSAAVDGPQQNGTLVVSQDGNSVAMSHTLEFNGQPFAEQGSGRIGMDGTIRWSVVVTLQIPGWATAGEHTLRLDADGRKMRGEYQDNKGNRGPMVFIRE